VAGPGGQHLGACQDGVRFDGGQNSCGSGGGGGGTPPFTGLDRTFIYTDGPPNPAENVYDDWATLHAAAATIDDATILFDPVAVGGTLVVPPNGGASWTFSGARTRFVGNLCNLDFASPVAPKSVVVELEAPIAGVCEFVGLARFINKTLRTGTEVPVLAFSSGDVLVLRDGAAIQGDTDPLASRAFAEFAPGGGFAVLFCDGGELLGSPGSAGSSAIANVSAIGGLQVIVLRRGTIQGDSISTVAGSTTLVESASNTQTDVRNQSLSVGTIAPRAAVTRRVGELGFEPVLVPSGAVAGSPNVLPRTTFTVPAIPTAAPQPEPSVVVPFTSTGFQLAGGARAVINEGAIAGADARLESTADDLWDGPHLLRISWHLSLALDAVQLPPGPEPPPPPPVDPRSIRVVPRFDFAGGAVVEELVNAEAITVLGPGRRVLRNTGGSEPLFFEVDTYAKVELSGVAYVRLDDASGGGIPGDRWTCRLTARGDRSNWTQDVPPYSAAEVPAFEVRVYGGAIVIDAVQPVPQSGGNSGP